MTAVRDELVRNNRTVNWMPDNIKEGSMGNFLENVVDWGLDVYKRQPFISAVWRRKIRLTKCRGIQDLSSKTGL